jgi:hypothetical protein
MTQTPDNEMDAFCIVEFVRGSRIERDPPVNRPASGRPADRPASGANLRIVQNGPPGTFVRFADGRRVPLPTDQIVSSEEGAGAARVGFGGMRFDGIEEGLLTFRRFRDLLAEHELSPERGRRMTLEPEMVAAVFMQKRLVWGRPMGES